MHSDAGRVERVLIAGVPADRITRDGAVELLAGRIRSRTPTLVAVTNANKAWLAARDDRLRGILEAADLAVPEWAMVWAARRLGVGPLHHVGGLTLMEALLERAARDGWTVYLVGATADVLETLQRRLPERYPGLTIVGAHHGHFDAGVGVQVAAGIRAARPDLLFVARGSPRQEYWLAELGPELAGATVAVGVGGSFDVLSGVKKDAPGWMRGRGLEWAYRLAQDPGRLWRRYLVTNTWFVARVLRQRLSGA